MLKLKDKILLVGQGAREHAIAKSLKKSEIELYAFMSAINPGIAKLSSKIKIANLNDYNALNEFVTECKPNIAVIGPENPLGDGIVDFLQEKKIAVIGPTKALAKIETSKAFTREVMLKYQIPGLPEYKVFKPNTDKKLINDYVKKIGKVVVKRDGLASGKGVKLMGEHLKDIEEVLNFCSEVFQKGESVVIEELLEGEEFSLQCFVSGEDVVATPIAQDHKRAFEGDIGPNTGGMGSYSAENHLLPFISEKIVNQAKEIVSKTAKAIKKETGFDYVGILYRGFMLTAKGLKLLEFNARFGDPEVINILPLLETPLLEIFKAMIARKLNKLKINFSHKATVCKYLVPEGYPELPKKDQPIFIEEEKIPKKNIELYYASVKEVAPNKIITTTSRAIAIVGIAESIENAEQKVEKAMAFVNGPLTHRKDIGTKKLIQKRIDHLKELKVL